VISIIVVSIGAWKLVDRYSVYLGGRTSWPDRWSTAFGGTETEAVNWT